VDWYIQRVTLEGSLGSDTPPEETRELGLSALFEAYFTAQRRLLETLHPAVVAHFALPLLFTPSTRLASHAKAREMAASNIAYAVSYGALFELSSAPFRKGWEEGWPGEETVKMIIERGGKFCLSDDAHNPGQVGLNYHRLKAWASKMGVREDMVWRLRRKDGGGVEIKCDSFQFTFILLGTQKLRILLVRSETGSLVRKDGRVDILITTMMLLRASVDAFAMGGGPSFDDSTMSAKYANLPDIDTAPDVYETEDVEPTSQAKTTNSSDEDDAKGDAEKPSIEELDPSSLLSAKDARKQFRKAEKRKARSVYTYPPATDESSDSDAPPTLRSRNKQSSQFERLLALKQELASLEAELAQSSSSTSIAPPGTDATTSPTTPKAQSKKRAVSGTGPEKDADNAGDLLKGVHDVRSRLERISAAKDGRGRLVDAVVGGGTTSRPTSGHSHVHGHGAILGTPLSPTHLPGSPGLHRRDGSMHRREGSLGGSQNATGNAKDEFTDPAVSKLDARVGELEKVVGSSGAALDESSPLPPPLLPMITRLNTQLTILTQPRTIDSISRRLKLLLTDLDRVAAQSATAGASTQGTGTAQSRGTGATSGTASNPGAGSTGTSQSSTIQEQLTPILQRLAPHLPTLPHILARLRTLSSLHAAAADFQRSMEQLEAQQKRNRSSIDELELAIKTLETSIQNNGEVEKNNVTKLEENIQKLLQRLEAVGG
ncbi:3030_t:CDS:2, partial [Acaulospora colombiana]